MSLDGHKNFAKVTVSTGYTSGSTSIVLSTGHGALLPSVPFNATWWNSTDYADPSDDPNVEIVRVTAISTDTLTVTRGQEGITATSKNTASKTYKMAAALTAKTLDDISSALVVSPSQGITFYDDFMNGLTTWQRNGFSTTTSNRVAGEQNHPGVWSVATQANTAAQRVWLGDESNPIDILLGGGQFTFECCVKFATSVAGISHAWMGLADTPPYSTDVDGVYLNVDGSGNLTLVTSSNSTATSSSTLTTLSADTWYRLGFIVNAAGTSVQAYVAGVATGSPNTTNIPTGAGRNCSPTWSIVQSGATSTDMRMDYIAFSLIFTTAR